MGEGESATGILRKNICVTLCSNTAGKVLFREQRYSSDFMLQDPTLYLQALLENAGPFRIDASI